MKYQVLILEDEIALLRGLVRGLSKVPSLEILTASKNEEAKKIIASTSLDLLISDLNLPDGSGLDSIQLYREKAPHGPLIVMTAYQNQYADRLQYKAGITILDKPISLPQLRKVVAEQLFENNLGTSAGPFQVQDFLQLAAIGRHSIRLRIEMVNGMVALCDVVEGEIWSAQFGEEQGVPALFRFLDEPAFAISYRSLARLPSERNVEQPLQGLLLEFARQKDEATLTRSGTYEMPTPVIQERLSWNLEKGPFNRFCLGLLKKEPWNFVGIVDLDQASLIGLAHKFPFLTRDLINKGLAILQEAFRGPRLKKFEKLLGEYQGQTVHNSIEALQYRAGLYWIRAELIPGSPLAFMAVCVSQEMAYEHENWSKHLGSVAELWQNHQNA
ncbi:MAG: response regulator [Acidobacteria bacterium]|nr:response regulator [Acidobacteriota bacterium]MCB9399380.1 response regulator [Acidobacteriota bacterium]